MHNRKDAFNTYKRFKIQQIKKTIVANKKIKIKKQAFFSKKKRKENISLKEYYTFVYTLI